MSGTVRQLPSSQRRKGLAFPSRQNLLLIGLGLLAVNFLIYAVSVGGRGNEGPPTPIAIERVIPQPGTLIASQEEIGADLDDQYTGILIVDGSEIPLDQLRIVDALGQVFFRPGEKQDIERLAEGNHSATVIYWPQDKTQEEAGKSYTWQFKAN
jgi:hypothetical protein